MIALFAVRSLMSPNTSYLKKCLIVIGVIVMMSGVFMLQQSGFGLQTFLSITYLGNTSRSRGGSEQQMSEQKMTAEKCTKCISALTWNIGAVNNNPFEYWLTNEDSNSNSNSNYNRIMTSVSNLIESPGDFDAPVNTLFTDQMFEELAELMVAADWTGVNKTRALWQSDYRNRKIISQFITDKELNSKGLITIPDRITNTINTVDATT